MINKPNHQYNLFTPQETNTIYISTNQHIPILQPQPINANILNATFWNAYHFPKNASEVCSLWSGWRWVGTGSGFGAKQVKNPYPNQCWSYTVISRNKLMTLTHFDYSEGTDCHVSQDCMTLFVVTIWLTISYPWIVSNIYSWWLGVIFLVDINLLTACFYRICIYYEA